MNHSFNVEVATRLSSMGKAVILENLAFWIKKNISNKKHKHDGYFWTYNSASAFADLFPYLKRRTISRWIKEMEQDGIIKTANYNKAGFDKTNWYTIIDADIMAKYSIGQNGPSIGHSGQPIPDINRSVAPIEKSDNLASTPPSYTIKNCGCQISKDSGKEDNIIPKENTSTPHAPCGKEARTLTETLSLAQYSQSSAQPSFEDMQWYDSQSSAIPFSRLSEYSQIVLEEYTLCYGDTHRSVFKDVDWDARITDNINTHTWATLVRIIMRNGRRGGSEITLDYIGGFQGGIIGYILEVAQGSDCEGERLLSGLNLSDIGFDDIDLADFYVK